MAGEQDDSGRFDYLFERLDDDVANTQDVVAATVENADAKDRRARTAATRIGIAAVIVAMIAVAVATVLFLLQRPTPASRLDTPTRTTPSVEPIATTEPVFQTPPPVTASSIAPMPTPAVVVPQPVPQLQPQPAPTTSAGPASPMPPSPTMRAPISVEPEPHPPFPNQNAPSGNDDQGGGLLGGLF
jgi:hypothetical protein